jgi:hypothetical protein
VSHPERGSNVAASAPSRPRVAAVYHRPFMAAFHGGSIHFRSFVRGLADRLEVEVVAPTERRSTVLAGHAGEPQMVGFRYLLGSVLEQARFVIREARRPPNRRARAIAAFDIYGAGFASVWSALRSIPLIYYPQDSNRTVGRNWSESGYKGGLMFRVTRFPLEWLGLHRAWRVVVPSAAVGDDLVAEGVDASRVRLCTLKREVPVERPADTNEWRKRLELGGRIGAVFVGSFQYAPNVRAFEFLRNVVAPALRSTAPDVLILVAGLDSESHLGDSTPNLRVLGTVADLDGLLFASSIGLAPTDVAGGTSGKIVDYVLHGLEVIATPEAAQGLEGASNIVTVSLAEYADAIRATSDHFRTEPGTSHRPVPDAEFLRRYTRSDDLDRLAEEVVAIVA